MFVRKGQGQRGKQTGRSRNRYIGRVGYGGVHTDRHATERSKRQLGWRRQQREQLEGAGTTKGGNGVS